MESPFGCKFFVVLLGLLSNCFDGRAVANASDTLLELTIEPEMVNVGDNVLLRCQVTNLVMGQFIRWSKVVEEDNQPMTYNVATNGLLESEFQGPRYSATFKSLGPVKVEFKLSINDVRNEDGGKYRCSMGDIVSESELVVYVPPATISMTLTRNGTDRIVEDGEEIKFEDGSLVSLRCEVGGSNPKPEVVIKLGDGILEEVQLFPTNNMDVVQGDAKGQVRSTWSVTAKATDLMISHETAANAKLSCEAKVRDDMSIATGFTVKMEGRPPMFYCDAVDQMARVNERNVILQCTAKATPPVTSGKVYYMLKDKTKVTVEPDTYDPSYELFMETHDETGETTMRLIIARVKPQMFRNYTFYVYNEIGQAEHSIKLNKDPSQAYYADPSSSSNLLASMLVTVVFAMLQILL